MEYLTVWLPCDVEIAAIGYRTFRNSFDMSEESSNASHIVTICFVSDRDNFDIAWAPYSDVFQIRQKHL